MPEQKDGNPSVQIILSPSLEQALAEILGGKKEGEGAAPASKGAPVAFSFLGVAVSCC